MVQNVTISGLTKIIEFYQTIELTKIYNYLLIERFVPYQLSLEIEDRKNKNKILI